MLKRTGSHRQSIVLSVPRQVEVSGRIHGYTDAVGGPTVGLRDIGIAIQARVKQVGSGRIEHRDKRRTHLLVVRVDGVVKSRSWQHGIRCSREAAWNGGG